MARWAPGAAERLGQAALELFTERGYDATAVAEIAARAGVTERTFFRHFSDKREVLFAGEERFTAAFVEAIAQAPADASVIDLIARALEAGGGALQEVRDRDFARMRYEVIAANEQLREREQLKLAKLGRELASALADRGVPPVSARLAADVIGSVFNAAFEQWIEADQPCDLIELQRENLGELRHLLSAERAHTARQAG